MKFKHLVVFTTAGVTALAMYVFTALAADAQSVTVNGSPVDLSPAPIIQAGRVFVPLRGVFEQLGASVVYSNGTINATGNGREVSLQIGSTEATVNGQPQTIDVAPFIIGSSTYVPLRFISEALGDSVSWDDANSIAAIDTGGGSATYFTPGTASYVDTAPPPIPVYEQPYVPEPNYIWQPGYWAWGSYGYYWVPGTWVQAPQPGYLWTPGYWQWNNGGYNWSPGYWASSIGFYGGINYGAGYYGRGYDGGRWTNNAFRYNTYVTRVNTTIVRNVYIDRNVYVNKSTTPISYNGGQQGLQARPSPQQLAAARGRHLGMTAVQQQHVRQAEQDRRLLASVNHNRPPVLAVARPLSANNHPSGLVPVKPSDRVNPQANVAPVPIPAAREARPAARAPGVPHVAPGTHAPPLNVAPAAHAPVNDVNPAAHAPVNHVNPAAHAPPARAAHAPVIHGTPAARAPAEIAPAARAPVEVAPPPHAPAVRVAPPYAPAVHAAPAARAPAVYAAPVHAPAVHAAPPAHVHAAPPVHAPAGNAAPPAHAPAAHEEPKQQKPPG